jgi:hypothetical protein
MFGLLMIHAPTAISDAGGGRYGDTQRRKCPSIHGALDPGTSC